MSSNQKMGFKAEKWVKAKLEKMGFDVEMHPDWQAKSCDLIVNGSLVIEVKESNERTRKYTTKDGRTRFYPWFQINTTSIDTQDRVLVFVAKDKLGIRHAYVMPGAIAGERSSMCLSSHPDRYTGYLSAFRECWDIVGYMLNKAYQEAGQLGFEGVNNG
jgi:hypothetical protein